MTNVDSVFFRERHPFHILPASSLPFVVSLALFVLLFAVVAYLHEWNAFGLISNETMLHVAFLVLWFGVISWILDVLEESALGFHTKRVQQGLRYGFAFFILSEVMFFFAFFWAFFHYSVVPSIYIGDVWPPHETQPIDVWYLPLINTILLLLSGFAITRAHTILLGEPAHSKMGILGIDGAILLTRPSFDPIFIFAYKDFNVYALKALPYGFLFTSRRFLTYLWCTIVFGLTFLWVQGLEYKYGVKFSWRGNLYGSIFFLLTGFHGFHVTVGLFFLFFCFVVQNFAVRFMTASVATGFYSSLVPSFYISGFMRNPKITFIFMTLFGGYPLFILRPSLFLSTKEQHVGFEVSAWYWHFVDVVWLFLFITVYWWGSTLDLDLHT